MVEAGWVYDPSPDNEDGVSCPYCGLSLDGWERKDDPMYAFYTALYHSSNSGTAKSTSAESRLAHSSALLTSSLPRANLHPKPRKVAHPKRRLDSQLSLQRVFNQ